HGVDAGAGVASRHHVAVGGGGLDPGREGERAATGQARVAADIDIGRGAVKRQGVAVVPRSPGRVENRSGVAVPRGIGGGRSRPFIQGVGRDGAASRRRWRWWRRGWRRWWWRRRGWRGWRARTSKLVRPALARAVRAWQVAVGV